MTATPTFTDPKTWAFQEGVESAELNIALRDNTNSMGPHLVVRKPSDESVISSVTFQADNHLILPVGVNEVWLSRWVIYHTGSSSGNLKYRWTFPTGGSGAAWTVALDPSSTTVGYQTSFAGGSPSPQITVLTLTTGILTTSDVIYMNGGTGGNVTLEWAQSTSNGTPTTIKANSTLWGVQLA